MSKISFIIPYPSIAGLIQSTIREQADHEWEYETIMNVGVQPIIHREIKSDVIIARGVTAVALRRKLPDIPVIDLPVTGYDILRAVKRCLELFKVRQFGVVGSHDMIYGVKSIESIMAVVLETVEVNDEEDARPSLAKLKDKDIHTIIGGAMSCGIAQQLGMNSLFIESGREAIYSALREAKRVAEVRRREKERAEQFRTILDYSDEGIIAVDGQGRINLMNTAAIQITNLRDEAIGGDITAALPQLALSRVLTSGESEIGDLQTVNNQQIAIKKVPIIISGEPVGAIATFRPVASIQELESKIREKIYNRGHVAKAKFDGIVGSSKVLKEAITIAREFSTVNSNVLILGETGSGKEVFAQSIHNGSTRCQAPFVAINCAALPETLLESELFGYSAGAFTGAARGGKVGLFELAHRGTIFLDEIAEISPQLQGRLLRVLQEREIMRLGDDRIIPIDVRIIAATNKDLYERMEEGSFRADLYYRLDILKLLVPPLRERREDIILLMNHFIKLYCLKFNREDKLLDKQAQAALLAYSWPGNVRELKNIAERLVVLIKKHTIGAQDIEAMLPRARVSHQNALPGRGGDLDRECVMKALEETNYHYGKAATQLGISRTTLWKRLKQCNNDGSQ